MRSNIICLKIEMRYASHKASLRVTELWSRLASVSSTTVSGAAGVTYSNLQRGTGDRELGQLTWIEKLLSSKSSVGENRSSEHGLAKVDTSIHLNRVLLLL